MLDIELKPNQEDISTYSNFQEIIQKKVDIDISINFEQKSLYGTIQTEYEILNNSLEHIILDLHGPEVSDIVLINEDRRN